MCYTIFSPTQIETTKIVPPDLKKKKKKHVLEQNSDVPFGEFDFRGYLYLIGNT